MPSWIWKQVRQWFFQYEFLYPVAQWIFSDGCWEHHTCDTVLLHTRYSGGKWRKVTKTKKEEKQGTEDGKTLIWFHSSTFQTLAYTITIKQLPFIQLTIYKSRHRIIQSFGSEETSGGLFYLFLSSFPHKYVFTTPEMVSSHRRRTIAL